MSLAEESTANNICQVHQLGRWAVHSEKVCGGKSSGEKNISWSDQATYTTYEGNRRHLQEKKDTAQLYDQKYF